MFVQGRGRAGPFRADVRLSNSIRLSVLFFQWHQRRFFGEEAFPLSGSLEATSRKPARPEKKSERRNPPICSSPPPPSTRSISPRRCLSFDCPFASFKAAQELHVAAGESEEVSTEQSL